MKFSVSYSWCKHIRRCSSTSRCRISNMNTEASWIPLLARIHHYLRCMWPNIKTISTWNTYPNRDLSIKIININNWNIKTTIKNNVLAYVHSFDESLSTNDIKTITMVDRHTYLNHDHCFEMIWIVSRNCFCSSSYELIKVAEFHHFCQR